MRASYTQSQSANQPRDTSIVHGSPASGRWSSEATERGGGLAHTDRAVAARWRHPIAHVFTWYQVSHGFMSVFILGPICAPPWHFGSSVFTLPLILRISCACVTYVNMCVYVYTYIYIYIYIYTVYIYIYIYTHIYIYSIYSMCAYMCI